MQSEIKKRFEEILDEVSANETFTKDAFKKYYKALESVDELQDEVDELKEHKENLSKLIDQSIDEGNVLREELEKANKELEQWGFREQGLITRENAIGILEVKLSCETQRVNDHIKTMETVFRNPIVKKSVIDSENQNWYDSNDCAHHNKNVTKTYDEMTEVE